MEQNGAVSVNCGSIPKVIRLICASALLCLSPMFFLTHGRTKGNSKKEVSRFLRVEPLGLTVGISLKRRGARQVDPRDAEGFELMEEIARHREWGAAFRVVYSGKEMRGDVPQQTDDGITLYHFYVWIHRSARNRRQQLEDAVTKAIKFLESISK